MLMEMALVVRQRSTCLRRQVGAVLAYDGRVLSTGYNGAPAGIPHCTPTNCNPTNPCLDTIHAEANAVAFASRHGIRTKDAALYTTASPCRECAKLLINAGIIQVFYAEEYRDISPIALLQQSGVTVVRWTADIQEAMAKFDQKRRTL
jgi:dCMP deaminase